MAPTKLHNIKLKHAIYMCNYSLSSVNSYPKRIKQLIAFPINKLFYESKGIRIVSMKCGNVKSGIGGSKLSTRVFILWFG